MPPTTGERTPYAAPHDLAAGCRPACCRCLPLPVCWLPTQPARQRPGRRPAAAQPAPSPRPAAAARPSLPAAAPARPPAAPAATSPSPSRWARARSSRVGRVAPPLASMAPGGVPDASSVGLGRGPLVQGGPIAAPPLPLVGPHGCGAGVQGACSGRPRVALRSLPLIFRERAGWDKGVKGMCVGEKRKVSPQDSRPPRCAEPSRAEPCRRRQAAAQAGCAHGAGCRDYVRAVCASP